MKIISFLPKISSWLLLMCLMLELKAQPMQHPGLLQSQADLERMKAGVNQKSEPLYAGYLVFKAHPQSQFDYQIQGPSEMVSRNPTVGQAAYDADANAAFQNALMWVLTGDKRHATKAQEIVNKWAGKLQSITGRDAVLMAGLGPFKMVNAAEILRYSNSGWTKEAIAQAEKHFQSVVYPVIKDLAPFANGNWDSAALKTMMAIAIFCNNRPMLEQALRYYQNGSGDGSLPNYIINDSGQCQESGRDQGHTQLGIAHLADCCQMAWSQGLDLYRLLNYRLLKGFEYTAKYNLGQEVPYQPAMDRTGKYWHASISEQDRGKIRAVYEEVYNHYVNRLGMNAIYVQQAAEKIRPELQGLPGADHMGFGTLLYSLPKGGQTPVYAQEKTLASPAGLYAVNVKNGLQLNWVPVTNATGYLIKRSVAGKQLFTDLARTDSSSSYQDNHVTPGIKYVYTVTALRGKERGGASFPLYILAGLPAGWKQTNLSVAQVPPAACDGEVFTIEGATSQNYQNMDGGTLLTRIANGSSILQARYVPQLSSQFTRFGLIFRDAVPNGGAYVKLMVLPQVSSQIEAPGWIVQLSVRTSGAQSATLHFTSAPLDLPIVTFSRMTGNLFLKLERKGSLFTAAFSADNQNWLNAGSVNIAMNQQAEAGLFAESGLKEMTTTVKFDQVRVGP